MSVLNNKSGINRLFPFAKKKPNIPTKLSDKVDSNTIKQKVVEEKNCPDIKASSEQRCDVLTENNDKAKPEEKSCGIEIPKKVLSETCKKILKSDHVETTSKNKKAVSRKSSSVSDVSSIEEVKKPKENYQRWNIPFSSKFKGKEFDKTLLTMQDLIYYNPVSNPIIKEAKIEQKQEDDPDDDLLPIESDQKPTVSNCITPCIKVGVDGKIIIDQETLTLNETGLEEKREELAKAKVIEESAFNSRSYSYRRKKEPYKQWNKDETLKFYKCLMNLGTDFSMIQQYFPGRTRAQIKRKYKTEEKKNPQLINGALTNTTHYDSVLLENMFQEDEPEVIEVTKVQAKSDVTSKPPTRKRRHKDVVRSECSSRMSVCAYLLEEEIVLKNKRNIPGKAQTASNLKNEVLALQTVKEKKRKRTPLKTEINSKIETKNIKDQTQKRKCAPLKIEINSKIEISSPTKCDKKNEPIPKVRRLQDFHNEYEENITKYEDSNSE